VCTPNSSRKTCMNSHPTLGKCSNRLVITRGLRFGNCSSDVGPQISAVATCPSFVASEPPLCLTCRLVHTITRCISPRSTRPSCLSSPSPSPSSTSSSLVPSLVSLRYTSQPSNPHPNIANVYLDPRHVHATTPSSTRRTALPDYPLGTHWMS